MSPEEQDHALLSLLASYGPFDFGVFTFEASSISNQPLYGLIREFLRYAKGGHAVQPLTKQILTGGLRSKAVPLLEKIVDRITHKLDGNKATTSEALTDSRKTDRTIALVLALHSLDCCEPGHPLVRKRLPGFKSHPEQRVRQEALQPLLPQ